LFAAKCDSATCEATNHGRGWTVRLLQFCAFVRSRHASLARHAGFRMRNVMLPDFRFVVGAAVVTTLLGMTGLALFVGTRLSQPGKKGPLETARSLAFSDHAEWNQFYDADSVRRFMVLGPRAEAAVVPDDAAEHQSEEFATAVHAIALLPLETSEAGRPDEAIPVLDAAFAVEDTLATIAVPTVPAFVERTASDQPPGESAAVLTGMPTLTQRPDIDADNSPIEARGLTPGAPLSKVVAPIGERWDATSRAAAPAKRAASTRPTPARSRSAQRRATSVRQR
jgi:hypothetical protein